LTDNEAIRSASQNGYMNVVMRLIKDDRVLRQITSFSFVLGSFRIVFLEQWAKYQFKHSNISPNGAFTTVFIKKVKQGHKIL
jgi:hypothetical protein